MALPPPSPDTTVLVTGASSGIGEQIARVLAARGYGLTLVARRAERLDALAAELRASAAVDVRVNACDLADDEARAALLAGVSARGLPVVGVVNNAGFGAYGRFDAVPRAEQQRMVRLNALALHELTGAFLDPMLAARAGAILNLASIVAYQPVPGFATYSATKAFVQTFSEALHTELAGTGVSVTTLSPGPVRTEFSQVAGLSDSAAPAAVMVSAADVALAGVRGMLRGRRTVVPGLATKAIVTGGRHAPRTALLPVLRRAGGAPLRKG